MNRVSRFCLIGSAAILLAASTGTAAEDRRKSATPPSATGGKAAPAAKSATAGKTAAVPKVPSPGSFEAYQLVVERNIFNPNRVGRTRSNPDEKQPRIDEISLVGTMESERGRVAFFESPDSAYRKALREGETMGDFKVQRIANDGVELLREEKPLALKISQQLRRPEGGEWIIRATPSAIPEEVARAAAAPEIPADASDVLKRLLKQRESQLKK